MLEGPLFQCTYQAQYLYEDSKLLCKYFLGLVHSISSWLVWLDNECSTVHDALPKWSTKEFKLVQKADKRQLELTLIRAYCRFFTKPMEFSKKHFRLKPYLH